MYYKRNTFNDRDKDKEHDSPDDGMHEIFHMLKKAAGLAKGSGVPNRDKVGKVTKAQILEIVKTKENDLNASNEDAACKIIEGTARSMGIEVI